MLRPPALSGSGGALQLLSLPNLQPRYAVGRCPMSSTVVRHWLAEVSAAALPFESRWTMLALKRVDPELARRLFEQRGLFDQACVTGSVDEVETHGAAMCRGWGAAVRVLASADEPDDAYQIGQDPATGLKVAIGHQRAAMDRVRDLHGDRVVWVTPDEVAKLMSSVEQFKFVGAVKQLFPGAEIIDRYPDEVAKSDHINSMQ